MKRISLTRGHETIVDDEDYEILSCRKWRLSGNSRYFCAARNTTILEPGPRKSIIMSREIMGLKPGDGLEVDHVDGDTLNNTRANLRVCTRAQNSRNRRANKGRALPKGVRAKGRRFAAEIVFRGKAIHLGMFGTQLQAATAYDAAAKKYHREFARINGTL